MGRHSIIDPRDMKNPYAMRGVAVAGVVGVLAGAGIPAATAAPQEASSSTGADAALATVSLQAEPVAVETVQAEDVAQTVSLTSSANSGWSIDNVDVEIVEAPAVEIEVIEPAPVAQTVTPQATSSSYTPTPVSDLPPSNSAIVNIARQYAGVPYVYGGNTPAGWDCSGFVQYVFAQAGIYLPRTDGAQAASGYVVSAADAQPGDLVWWPGHVGIYTGNGQHIAARRPGVGTVEGPLYGSPTFIRIVG
ncbi:MAG: hypothetical protein GX483_03115 [Actinomycetaceae bacterium]|nr:hypothetical protein [Actinomycetaceae bacterium]